MERMSKTMAEGKEDLERAFNIMNEELLKAEYKARVGYYGKYMNEIMEEVAKETKSYKELEEENKKLKEFKTKRKESMFYFKALAERAEPKTAREAEDLQRAKEIFEKLYREELSCLEEENKKLKEELKHREDFRKNCSDGIW